MSMTEGPAGLRARPGVGVGLSSAVLRARDHRVTTCIPISWNALYVASD